MRQFGPAALFFQAALVHAVMAGYALWRLLVEPETPQATSVTP
jgi:hypothetical protein